MYLLHDILVKYTLPKISFLKLQGRARGAPITPRGRLGVDVMDLDHNIT